MNQTVCFLKTEEKNKGFIRFKEKLVNQITK